MSASLRHHILTLDDYFSAERNSPDRHEFTDGQIYLMAGGSPRHDFLETRIIQLLGPQLEGGPCYAMSSNRRIATADELYTYADGSVFCGEMTLGPMQTATNPVVLFEVLSDGTRAYDRGEKLTRYRSVPSLRHVVLIEQDGVDVEVWSRNGETWSRKVHVDRADRVSLPGIQVELSVGDIYEGAEQFPTGGSVEGA